MNECIVCLEEFHIPLLKCGHFVCPCCYCGLKNRKMNGCPYCKKRMIRGTIFKKKLKST